MCISTTSTECNINTDNNVTISNNNVQVAWSGNGLNTGSGESSTGSATNSNGTTFSITITNGVATEGGMSKACVAYVTVPATTVVTPTTPVVTTKATPKVLPNTSSDATASYVVTLAAILGIGAIASYLFAKAYSRR